MTGDRATMAKDVGGKAVHVLVPVHLLVIWLVLVLALLMSVAPMVAHAQEGPKPEPQFVLRGPERPEPLIPAPPPEPASPPRRSDFPGPAPAAPRTGGLESQTAGGAVCRKGCASRYYFCLSRDQGDYCGVQWGRCVRDCPRISGAE